MKASQVQRLQEEQDRAVQITNDEIDKWKKLNTDYKNLSDRLLTLPNKITHEVMVPFGPFAFMPGQLVHTNEIMVLLGENWFVERSAKQATQIVKRRIKSTEKQLEDLQLQKNLLVNRTSFTNEIHHLTEGMGEIKEITEKYDEEKEKEWKVQHKQNVKKYRADLQRKKLEDKETNRKKQEDESLWERLEELEKLEAERNELDEDDTVADTKHSQEESQPPPSAAKTLSPGQKTVRWLDEITEEKDPTDSSSSESDEGPEHDKRTENKGNPGVIHFTHSPVVPCLTELTASTQKEEGSDMIINSPTDIYKYFGQKSQTAPKSILKSTSFEGNLPQENSPSVPVKKIEQKSHFQREKAVTEEVVEKIPQMPINKNTDSDTKPQQPKPVSRFKASRSQR